MRDHIIPASILAVAVFAVVVMIALVIFMGITSIVDKTIEVNERYILDELNCKDQAGVFIDKKCYIKENGEWVKL